MGIFDKAKQAALTATVTKALDYLEKDPEYFASWSQFVYTS